MPGWGGGICALPGAGLVSPQDGTRTTSLGEECFAREGAGGQGREGGTLQGKRGEGFAGVGDM